MKPIMDIQEILRTLPHRYPLLLVDRVIELDPGKSIVAIKNVTVNEAFFPGHFPGRPIMPGVLMLEALAQTGALLAYKSTNTTWETGAIYLFAGIDNARFRRVVEPGDTLQLRLSVLRAKRDIWKLDAQAFVGDELACSAELLSARSE